MTNGTSQGLFIVVAIIIFGIFIAISYLLFRDTLKPSLSTIFTDSLEQAEGNLTRKTLSPQYPKITEEQKYVKIRSENNGAGETEIWVEISQLEDGTLSIDKSSNYNGDYLYGNSKMTGTLVFPDKIHDIPVTKIKNNAFQSTNLNGKIQFPKFLTEIGSSSFEKSAPTSVVFNDGLKVIGDSIFSKAYSSFEINLPDSVEHIGNNAFSTVMMLRGELKLPENLKTIGRGAFANSNYSGELIIPENVESIESLAFPITKFSKVTIKNPNTKIANNSIKMQDGTWFSR